MGLVCFAFGAAAAGQPDAEVTGPVLVRLLADLGLSGPAARSVLLRMRQDGWLLSARAGREARYRLAPAVSSAQARIEAQLRRQRPPWTGSFCGILYEGPERDRAYRDRLRRSALLLGYAMLRPGLLVASSDRWAELAGLLPARPPGSELRRTQLTFSAADSRQLAARLWNLDTLAARYRGVLGAATALIDAAERNPPAGPAAFAAFAAATLPIFEVTTDDPDLPSELLPPGWPGGDLGEALGQAFRVFGPQISSYLAAIARPWAAAPRRPTMAAGTRALVSRER